MSRKTKTTLAILVVGILVLGGIVGGVVNHALAQPGTGEGDASTPKEEFLSGVAGKLGVPVDQLTGAIQSTELEMLDKAVEQGKVRPEVADRLRQRIEEGQVLPSLPKLATSQGRLGPGQRVVLRAAADALNMTPQDLVKEMRTTGKSLAQVAEERGVSRDDLKSGVTTNVEKYLDKGLERLGANIDRIIDWAPGQSAASPTQ